MNALDKLFTPFVSEKLTLSNRFVMAPMTRQFSPGSVPNEGVAGYYARRAEGGVGLIVTEGTCVNHAGAHGYDNVPSFYGEAALEGWRHVVQAVHAAGGKIAPQLWHVGAVRKPGSGPNKEAPAYSPSGVFKQGKPNGVAMTQDDIDDVVKAFADSAAAAKEVGFDAIELHGAHGYLIDQFLWEGTNQREDAYGGSLEKRARFAVEIIAACRDAVGEDFPIIFRLSQWKQQDYQAKLAQTPEELATLIELLSNAGVDIFHCSTRRFWEPEFDGSDLNLAGWVTKLSGKPAITVGSVGLDGDFIGEGNADLTGSAEPTGIEKLVDRFDKGEFDLVAVGRALLVDPNWVNKIREGNLEAIKPYTKDALMSLS